HPSADRLPIDYSIGEVGFYQNANPGHSTSRDIDDRVEQLPSIEVQESGA
ncbi:unnamed protein product, partial [Soboliphyme baturini]|uniref:Transposase n=1 Tax=Soboliphyme baturini TaxID=241478 RepID=A0A183IQF2_9BILA